MKEKLAEGSHYNSISLDKDSASASRPGEGRHYLRGYISALRSQTSLTFPGSLIRHSIPIEQVEVLVSPGKHKAE